MELIWHHAFYNELRVEPDEKPVWAGMVNVRLAPIAAGRLTAGEDLRRLTRTFPAKYAANDLVVCGE